MGLNDWIQAAFDGYKEAKATPNYPREFEKLEHTRYLYGSEELNDLYHHAKTKQDYETILGHMYRFDATEVKSYEKIEKKIINKFRED